MPITLDQPTNPSGGLGLFVPTLLVLGCYAGLILVHGAPESAPLLQRQNDLAQLRMRSVGWDQVEELSLRVEQLTQDRDAAKADLEASRNEALRITSNLQESLLPSVSLLARMTAVLERNHLVTTSHGNYRKSGRPRMYGYLDSSLRSVQVALASVAPAKPAAGYIVDEDSFHAAQAARAHGLSGPVGELPKLTLHEIEVWGSYQDLVGALDDIAVHCDESVVLGVDFRRFENAEGVSALRIKLIVNFQPMPLPRGPRAPRDDDRRAVPRAEASQTALQT